jgi:flavin-dependent dehydrogenase
VSPYVRTAAGPLHHKLVAALAAPGAVVTGGHQEGDACFVRKNQEKNMKQVILSEGNNGILGNCCRKNTMEPWKKE